jgi:hypothetical protein
MALSSQVERYLTFDTTSLACGYRNKHIQRTNSSADPAPHTPGLAACSPPCNPPIVLNRRKTCPHGPLLLSRTIPYLRHYLTGLWVPKKHIQRTNSSTDPAPLNLGLAACLPPFTHLSCSIAVKQVHVALSHLRPHVSSASHSPSAKVPCF